MKSWWGGFVNSIALQHVTWVLRQLSLAQGGSEHPVRGNTGMAGFKSGFCMLRPASGGLPNVVDYLSIV